MNWFTGIVVYILTWWVVLFAILPIGIRPRADRNNVTTPDPHGHEKGAPENPRILWRFFTTSWVAAIVWFLLYLLISSNLISFREMASHMK